MVELDVYCHSSSSSELADLGINYSLSESCEIRKMCFFTIDAIGHYTDNDGRSYCMIYSAGDHFIVADTYDNVMDKLDM